MYISTLINLFIFFHLLLSIVDIMLHWLPFLIPFFKTPLYPLAFLFIAAIIVHSIYLQIGKRILRSGQLQSFMTMIRSGVHSLTFLIWFWLILVRLIMYIFIYICFWVPNLPFSWNIWVSCIGIVLPICTFTQSWTFTFFFQNWCWFFQV